MVLLLDLHTTMTDKTDKIPMADETANPYHIVMWGPAAHSDALRDFYTRMYLTLQAELRLQEAEDSAPGEPAPGEPAPGESAPWEYVPREPEHSQGVFKISKESLQEDAEALKKSLHMMIDDFVGIFEGPSPLDKENTEKAMRYLLKLHQRF